MRLIDRHAQTNRWRRFPAAEKALLAIGLMIVALTGSWSAQVLVIMVTATSLIVGARIPARDVWNCVTIPLGFIAASTAAQVITLHFEHGAPVFGISLAALRPAAWVALRSVACVSALIWLALTTPLTDIVQLLRRVGVSAELSDIALMMFRFVWLTLDCAEAGVQSQANRLGYVTYRGGLHSLGLLLSSLLPRVLSRARRLESGLAARGYTGELRFVELSRPLSSRRLLAVAAVLISVAVVGQVVR